MRSFEIVLQVWFNKLSAFAPNNSEIFVDIFLLLKRETNIIKKPRLEAGFSHEKYKIIR